MEEPNFKYLCVCDSLVKQETIMSESTTICIFTFLENRTLAAIVAAVSLAMILIVPTVSIIWHVIHFSFFFFLEFRLLKTCYTDYRRNLYLALSKWRESIRMTIVHVVCLVVYDYIVKLRSRSRIFDRKLALEKERIRDKIMKEIATSEGRKIIRMSPKAFFDLCDILQREGGLQPTLRVSVEEQVVKTLYILTHNVKNREIQFWFRRSCETTSRHFHRVLRSIIELGEKYLKQPDDSHIPVEILGSSWFYPYFKDCVGEIDCTHVCVKVSSVEAIRYRGRKDFPTQNVLVACSFDLRFTYVLAGCEGTASDSRILKDALHRANCLKIPREVNIILDAGFMLRKGLVTPFRSTRYHLNEFSTKNPPRTPRELFNHRHSSLRNVVERAFGILKKRFPIIANGSEPTYGINTQNMIIIACCILHNYLMVADPDEELLIEVDEEISNQNAPQNVHACLGDNEDEEHTRLGENLRNSIVDAVWRYYTS